MRALQKTTIVIWSEPSQPVNQMELSTLAREAEQGGSYCSKSHTEFVDDPETDPTWDGTEFFDIGEDW